MGKEHSSNRDRRGLKELTKGEKFYTVNFEKWDKGYTVLSATKPVFLYWPGIPGSFRIRPGSGPACVLPARQRPPDWHGGPRRRVSAGLAPQGS